MVKSRTHTWQEVQQRIRQNIKDGTWLPGQLIPGEVTLAGEFGCARATVNRALRELAQTGVIDRKRKAGTRVAMQQARRVSAAIPVIRSQIESRGHTYRFTVLSKKMQTLPVGVATAMQVKRESSLLHIRSVHYADDSAYIYEDRWINTQTIPDILSVDLVQTSANEWLVEHIPFTSGEFVVEAIAANKTVARALGLEPGQSLLKSRRLTWLERQSVTLVNLFYAAGHQIRFEI
jgi:GntR family histidine utilization transcriptional repressor